MLVFNTYYIRQAGVWLLVQHDCSTQSFRLQLTMCVSRVRCSNFTHNLLWHKCETSKLWPCALNRGIDRSSEYCSM